jgi:hypothetical protein
MKISEIKSDEVRNEAVRLTLEDELGIHGEITKEDAMDKVLAVGFDWHDSPQLHQFWYDLYNGTTQNTPDLKLPEKNPSE